MSKPRVSPTECARWRCDGEGVVGLGLTPPEAYRAWLAQVRGQRLPQRLTAIGHV